MHLQTLRQIIFTFIEIILLSLLFEVNKTGAIKTFKFNLIQLELKGQLIRIIQDCTLSVFKGYQQTTLIQLIVDINWTLKKYNVHYILE